MEKSPESSPEFEFWMVGNPPPSFPQPQYLLTADELFADGIILPLIQPLSSSPSEPNHDAISPPPPPPPPAAAPPLPTTTVNPSKRWKQKFRSRDAKEKAIKITTATAPTHSSLASIAASTAAELNIHIWPFSRSRSAGSNVAASGSAAPRPRAFASGRKSCSAPCSRSNSRGETPKPAAAAPPKKWGLLAGGIHVGRSMPVWQLKRSAGKSGGGSSTTTTTTSSATVGVLNLNVNTCIGYGSQVRNCRDEDKDEVPGGDQSGGADGGRSGSNGSLFNLRTIFSKKVY